MENSKGTIWILNHYATTAIEAHGGRHYYFARYLKKQGYDPVIFCASSIHNKNTNVELKNIFCLKKVDGIKTIIIKTRPYSGNGKERVLNMVDFYLNVKKAAKAYIMRYGIPKIIYASSVHPLTLVAGIQIARKYDLRCVCEVRDLWPETLVADNIIKDNSLLGRCLYRGEHWIYKNADALIFTMEGGKKYIQDKKWDMQFHKSNVDLNKVFHINNGVDIKQFDDFKAKYTIDDIDLNDKNTFKCIYTGSIRQGNNVDLILDAAKYIKEKGFNDITFLIYGEGDQVKHLQDRICNEKLSNVYLKGYVDKRFIPYIVSHCSISLMNFEQSEDAKKVLKYGLSLNKSFEYLAAARPILNITGKQEYDYIETNGAGITIDVLSPKDYGEAIIRFYQMNTEKYNLYCTNARKTAVQNYDFSILTNKLVEVFEYALNK